MYLILTHVPLSEPITVQYYRILETIEGIWHLESDATTLKDF